MRWFNNGKQSKGVLNFQSIIYFLLAIVLVITIVPLLESGSIVNQISSLEGRGYIVLAANEYENIIDKLDNIQSEAEDAVIAAESAVDAAEIAATKVDLFNSAEVFLFPDVTNITVTLTAGNTNVWSNWGEVVDSNALSLSSRFAANSGYINDMYIYDHSAVDKLYCIELAYGDAKTTLGRIMWHTSFKDAVQIKSRRVPAGETIYYRMMCSGANGATAKIGFRYFYE